MGALQRILEHLGALETKHVLFVVFLSLSLSFPLCVRMCPLCVWIHGLVMVGPQWSLYRLFPILKVALSN